MWFPMRLDAFLLADDASAAEGKLYLHGAGITKITAPVLPWAMPRLAVVLRLQVEPSDLDNWTQEVVKLQMNGPDGRTVIPKTEIPLPSEPPELPTEGEEYFLQLILNFEPLFLEKTGAHRLELSLGEHMLRSMSLPVVTAK